MSELVSPEVATISGTSVRSSFDNAVMTRLQDAVRDCRVDDLFGVLSAMDEQIGSADTVEMQQQLVHLRARAIDEMLAAQAAYLQNAINRSPRAGWDALLLVLAEAVSQLRLPFARRLSEHPFMLPNSKRLELSSFGAAIVQMVDWRWPEAYGQIESLANLHGLPTVTRARLLVNLGHIQLYHFLRAARARELFEAAVSLAPNDARVLSALGDYWLGEKKSDEATSWYRRSIENAPGVANGYVGIGEYHEEKLELDSAEIWYRKAITFASGDSMGYNKLFKLYGRTEWFALRDAALVQVAEQSIIVNPEEEYHVCIDLGYVYQANDQFDEADRWFSKALALDATAPRAYYWIAYSYERQERYDDAEIAYKQAIAAAPTAHEGYLGLATLYEQQERWEEALTWYGRMPQHVQHWAEIARAKVGEMHAKLHRFDQAEEILTAELQTHGSKPARNALESIADQYYSTYKDREAACRLYRDLLNIVGDDYRTEYFNRLGNLHVYYDEKAQAIGAYQSAIEADSKSAVSHRNISGVYEEMKDYRQAERHLSIAHDLDRDTARFDRRMALLENSEGNELFVRGEFGAAAELYRKAIVHAPREDVFYANLAGALELAGDRGTRPEMRDGAIEAYRQAHTLKPRLDYERSIARLSQKKERAATYGERAVDWTHTVTPIAVEIAADLIPLTEGTHPNSLSDLLTGHLAAMRDRVEKRYGVTVPGVRVKGNQTDLTNGVYVIMLMEVPLVSGAIELNSRFHPGPSERLAFLGVTGKTTTNPLTGDPGCWIAPHDWARVEAGGFELWDVIEYPVHHLEAIILRNLGYFLGHQEIATALARKSPGAIADLKSQPEQLTAFTTVCRALVAEGVPVQPLGDIWAEFERCVREGVRPQNIVERLRVIAPLRRELPGNNGAYRLLPFGALFEQEILQALHPDRTPSVLAMEPERCRDALNIVRKAVNEAPDLALVVSKPLLRPFVQRLVELEYPNIPVLSRQELLPGAQVDATSSAEFDEPRTLPEPIRPIHEQPDKAGETGHTEPYAASNVEPIAITVFMNERLTETQSTSDDKSIEELLEAMREGLFYELGIVVPTIRTQVDNKLRANEYRFTIGGHRYDPVPGLKSDEFLVNDTVERLSLLNIKGRRATNPANGTDCAIVRDEEGSAELCRGLGLSTLGPLGFLVLALSAQIRRNAPNFQTNTVTTFILDSLRSTSPDLIDAAMQRYSVEQIRLVLCQLLAEEISVRNIRDILECMLGVNGTSNVDLERYIIFSPYADNVCPVARKAAPRDLSASEIADYVRTCFKRYISHKYTRGGNTLIVYLLHRDIERRFAEVGEQLSDDEKVRLKAAIDRALASLPATAQTPVVLTSMNVRRSVRRVIEAEYPRLAVLSYQELSLDLNIQPLERIAWS
jgi:type III secretory pathway component EscV/Flp pilus assembly protein TadD